MGTLIVLPKVEEIHWIVVETLKWNKMKDRLTAIAILFPFSVFKKPIYLDSNCRYCFVEPVHKTNNNVVTFYSWDGLKAQIKMTLVAISQTHTSLHILPFQTALEGGRCWAALLVRGSWLQPQQGRRMLPLLLSVPCSWLMRAAFYLLVYRHSAGLSFVTGSCTNLRSAAGSWKQLSGGWRHLHPASTQQNYREQTGRQSFMLRILRLNICRRRITWTLEDHKF